MKRVRVWVVLMGMVLALAVSVPAMADDKPVAMSEVGRLIDQDQTPQDILAVMAERGVGFRVSKTAVKRLEKWGFTEAQIELVRKIAAGEKVDLDSEPGHAEGEGEGEGAGEADGAGDAKDAFGVGYPNPDDFHAAEQKRIERAIKNAGLGYKRIELTRCTIYCSERRVRALVPMLKKLEADLIAKFPDSVSNACSPKSAHIVVVDGVSEWRNWVQSCFDSYEKDGIRYSFGPEADPRPQLIAGGGYMLPYATATHADKLGNNEAVARNVAYSLGHLMMGQAGGAGQPDGLQTGFGDLAEAMAHGTPSVMVYSYEKRELEGEDAWKRTVAQLFKDKKIKGPAAPWTYETSTMKPEHYAEAWSLVSTLAEAPEKFAEAVGMVRNKEKPMADAVRKSYGMDDRKLMGIWHKWVNR